MHHLSRACRRTCVLALTLLVAVPGLAAAQNAADAFTPYVNAKSLSGLAVDSQGNIWATSNGGALRYSPETGTWTQFLKQLGSGPRGNDLTTLAIDSSQRVWVGSATRGFTFYDPSTGRWDREQEEWPNPGIRVIRALDQGVYIGTQEGLSLKPTPTRTDICAPTDPSCIVPSFVINDYAKMGDTLWVATVSGLGRQRGAVWDSSSTLPLNSVGYNSKSLAVYDGVLWETSETTPGNRRTRRLLPTGWDTTGLPADRLVVSAGSLYGFSTGNVWRWDGVNWNAVPVSVSDAIRDMQVVAESPGRTVFYFATTNGLQTWVEETGTTARLLPEGPGISGEFQGLAIDSEGQVWAGTIGTPRLVSYDGTSWGLIEPGESGLEGEWIFNLYNDSRDQLWIGHCCCGSDARCRLDVTCGTDIVNIEAYRDAWAFQEDSFGRMWIGSDGAGAWVLDRTADCNWVTLDNLFASDPVGMRSNNVRALAVTPDGTYFGHLQNGMDYWPHGGDLTRGRDGSNWVHYGAGPVLLDESVAAMQAQGDEVWVATSSGIHKFRGGGLVQRCPSKLSDVIGDPTRRVNCLTADRSGNLWIGTESGILFLPRGGECGANGGAFLTYDITNSALPDDNVLSAALNPKDGSVWFGTSNGLMRVDPVVFQGSEPPADQYVLYPNPMLLTQSGVRVIFGVEIGGVNTEPVPLEDVAQPEVFDLNGQLVARFDTFLDTHWVWDGRNLNRSFVAPGLYIVRATTTAGEIVVLKLGVVR